MAKCEVRRRREALARVRRYLGWRGRFRRLLGSSEAELVHLCEEDLFRAVETHRVLVARETELIRRYRIAVKIEYDRGRRTGPVQGGEAEEVWDRTVLAASERMLAEEKS